MIWDNFVELSKMFNTALFRNRCKIVLFPQEPKVLLFSLKNYLELEHLNYAGKFLNESQ